jgi:hypothetical protein
MIVEQYKVSSKSHQAQGLRSVRDPECFRSFKPRPQPRTWRAKSPLRVLYDLRTNRAETQNVASQHPQEVDRMITEIGMWMDAEKQIKGFLGRGAKAACEIADLVVPGGFLLHK